MNTRFDGLAAAAALACIISTAGCAISSSRTDPSAPKLSTSEACLSLENTMDRASLSWPVANQPVSRESADLLLQGFEEVAARTDGDLRTTLDTRTDRGPASHL